LLTVAALADAVARIDARRDVLRDALNAADRALGDGDTGMTVAAVIDAWREVPLGASADVGAALVALGKATSQASGSSLAAVVAMGLRAAGRASVGSKSLDRAGVAAAVRATVGVIGERSGAVPGDKSVLDSLCSIADALAQGGDEDGLAVARDAAQRALDDFRGRESKLGRARMFGARSVGHDDPGMLAAVLVLDAARAA
jgi:dihydroxyacetone kinase-like protein